MKPLTQFLLTSAVMAVAVWTGALAGVPFFVTVVVMFFVINQAIFLYNSRAMLELRPIPARGYANRREALERDERELFQLGFRKIDEFYLPSISDAVVYAYKHQSEPVFFCSYHLGVKSFCDFVTKFEEDITLTTTSGGAAGATRRPPRRLAQIFGNLGYGAMFAAHARATAFMAQHSIRPADVPDSEFRAFFVKSVKEFYTQGREQRFFLLKFLSGMVTSAANKYKMPLEQQYPAGLTAEVLTG